MSNRPASRQPAPRGPPRIASLASYTQTQTIPNEVEALRAHISHQDAQISQLRSEIDILTRTLEQLVTNYRDLKNDSEASKKRDTQTQARLTRVETGQTDMRRTLETVEYHATIGYQNATADDQARQYMYDERHMEGDDVSLTEGEIQREASRINNNRRNRRR